MKEEKFILNRASSQRAVPHVFISSFFREYFPNPPLSLTGRPALSSCSSLLFSSRGKIKPHPIASTVSSPFTPFHLSLFIFLPLSSFPCHFRSLLFRAIFPRERRSPPSYPTPILHFCFSIRRLYLHPQRFLLFLFFHSCSTLDYSYFSLPFHIHLSSRCIVPRNFCSPVIYSYRVKSGNVFLSLLPFVTLSATLYSFNLFSSCDIGEPACIEQKESRTVIVSANG